VLIVVATISMGQAEEGGEGGEESEGEKAVRCTCARLAVYDEMKSMHAISHIITIMCDPAKTATAMRSTIQGDDIPSTPHTSREQHSGTSRAASCGSARDRGTVGRASWTLVVDCCLWCVCVLPASAYPRCVCTPPSPPRPCLRVS
jgi:hypothetical protein